MLLNTRKGHKPCFIKKEVAVTKRANYQLDINESHR